ncbi:hypothetical protein T8K17_14835 [Thalassobaculum sp. OXR-137]|uniref:hypothetical protein n=1 Tax=Thalassobaculum sp. OXR-137 TaxID=3100173 RepID=UPI002AC9EC38|nr:hypothetical protein [Thalassobaculum sp. OXR-137]WPZ32516.1 hypothetical protein T8K17_14835 [Thalassobaculum sp. OXR-137]
MANFELSVDPESPDNLYGVRNVSAQFVGEVRIFLGEVLNEFSDLLVETLIRPLSDLYEASGPAFTSCQNWCHDMPVAHIDGHDLRPRSLNRKLKVVNYWYQRLIGAVRQPANVLMPSRRTVLGPILRRLFEVLNSLLKSLLSAVPAGGAVVELKEMFEGAVDDLTDMS